MLYIQSRQLRVTCTPIGVLDGTIVLLGGTEGAGVLDSCIKVVGVMLVLVTGGTADKPSDLKYWTYAIPSGK